MKTRSLLQDTERPPVRRRLAVLITLVAAALGFTGMTAGRASALGYPIAYSINNDTDQTLYFVSAKGTGGKCNAFTGAFFDVAGCENRLDDYTSNVKPRVVTPQNNINLDSEINAFTLKQDGDITVTYRIGATGNDKVVLRTDPFSVKCTVEGTNAYGCVVLPVGVGRDFILYSIREARPYNPTCDLLGKYRLAC